jgi:hypothetical protein
VKEGWPSRSPERGEIEKAKKLRGAKSGGLMQRDRPRHERRGRKRTILGEVRWREEERWKFIEER